MKSWTDLSSQSSQGFLMSKFVPLRPSHTRFRPTGKRISKLAKNALPPLSLVLFLACGASAAPGSGIQIGMAQGAVASALPLVVIVGFYCLLAWSLRSFYCTDTVSSQNALLPWWRWLHPAVVSASDFGMASISSLQLLWFTLIVLLISLKSLVIGYKLLPLSPELLSLLGWPAASKITSIIISNSRLRLSLENWSWLIKNNFLRKGNTIDPRETACWNDLILTDGVFDPVRFQLIVFSFLLGIALLRGGSVQSFNVGSWNTLLVGSNALYLGGKALSPTAIKELDDRLTSIRTRESNRGVPSQEERDFIKDSIESAYGKKALGTALA